MGKLSIVIFILCFRAIVFPTGSDMKLIKTIGDDRDDYMFFQISSAIMSDKKDIFVSDSKGHFIVKYDWQGKFIKRIGQRGQGNQDLIMPNSLNIVDSKLYILDRGNFRIAWTDLNLSRLEYYRFTDPAINARALMSLTVPKHGVFIASADNNWDNKGRVIVFDWISNKWRAFFNRFPIDPGDLFDEKKKLTKERAMAQASLTFTGFPIIGFDPKRGDSLISFQFPDNPIPFYLYSKEGKELMRIDYTLEKKYKFPNYTRQTKPLESYEINVDKILPYRDKFLAFIVKIHQQRNKPGEIVEQLCLVIDRTRRIVESFNVEKGLTVFSITEDGYILAKNYESDEDQLLIYKFNLKDR